MLDIEEGVNGDAEKAKSKANLVLDKTRGFMKYNRRSEKYRNAKTRTKDWAELNSRLNEDELKYQSARSMDCGVPSANLTLDVPSPTSYLNGMNWSFKINGRML